MNPPRRVIAGLDAQGRSGILIDGPSNMVIWSTDDSPANNSEAADAGGGAFRFPTSGTLFVFSDFAPGQVSPMHATDTIDYIVVVFGEMVFVTETVETQLHAGDVLVDRGIMHAWRNDSDEPCRIMIVLCPARPVGSGATVSGEMRSTRGNA